MNSEPRCPTCRKPTPVQGNRYRPFCSERCKLLDLANWATERYRIAGPPIDESAPTEPPCEEG